MRIVNKYVAICHKKQTTNVLDGLGIPPSLPLLKRNAVPSENETIIKTKYHILVITIAGKKLVEHAN